MMRVSLLYVYICVYMCRDMVVLLCFVSLSRKHKHTQTHTLRTMWIPLLHVYMCADIVVSFVFLSHKHKHTNYVQCGYFYYTCICVQTSWYPLFRRPQTRTPPMLNARCLCVCVCARVRV